MADLTPAPALSSISLLANGTILLTWDYNAGWPNVAIQRSIDGVVFNTIDTLINYVGNQTFIDSSVDHDTQYWYRVKPYGYVASNVETGWSYPGAVTSLVATKQNEIAGVSLAWVNDGTGAYSTVYWKKSSESTWAHSHIAFSDSCVISSLDEGVAYDFKCALLGYGANEGAQSNVAVATVDLIAPTLLEAHSNTSTIIHLTWSDDSGFETGYEVYRDGLLIATTAADVEQYIDDPVVYTQAYTYKIRAVKGAVVSAWTAEIDCTAGVAPGTPVGLAVHAYDFEQIDLDWTLADIYADYIDLYQKITATGDWELLASLPGDVVGTSVFGLEPVVDYYYKLRARNASGQSPETGTVTALTDPDLTPPSDLAAVAVSDSQIQLTWTPVWEDATLYWRVERKVPDGAWELVEDLDPLVHEYLDGGLSPYVAGVQGTYTYRVSTWYGVEQGATSGEETCNTKTSGAIPTRQDAFFAMGPFLCLMADDLVGVRTITRQWVSKQFDFSNLDPKFFHTWKFMDRVQLEYENTASQVAVTVGISVDYGVTWYEKTHLLGDGTGGSSIKDFRGFVDPVTGLAVSCVPGIYFTIRIKCSTASGDVPWTGGYLWFDQGAEHFNTGLRD
jgi:hypothetical protein